MAITKNDARASVTRKLDFNAKEATGTSGQLRRSSRASKEIYRLDRMTSAELDHMLGETSSPTAVASNEEAKEKQKKDDNANNKGIKATNERVVAVENIFDNDTQLENLETEQNAGQDKEENSILNTDNSLANQDVNVDNSQLDSASTHDLPSSPKSSVGLQASTPSSSKDCNNCTFVRGKLKELLNFLDGKGCSNFNVTMSESMQDEPPKEEFVPLVKGSKVLVPLTKKVNIPLHIETGDPQEYVYTLMDMLYSEEEMANMTADGRTAGSTRMDSNNFNAILAYVARKYNSKEYNFNAKIMKELVNCKCYAARRKLWRKDGDSTASTVRPKLAKKVKKTKDNVDDTTTVNGNVKEKEVQKPDKHKKCSKRQKFKGRDKVKDRGQREASISRHKDRNQGDASHSKDTDKDQGEATHSRHKERNQAGASHSRQKDRNEGERSHLKEKDRDLLEPSHPRDKRKRNKSKDSEKSDNRNTKSQKREGEPNRPTHGAKRPRPELVAAYSHLLESRSLEKEDPTPSSPTGDSSAASTTSSKSGFSSDSDLSDEQDE